MAELPGGMPWIDPDSGALSGARLASRMVLSPISRAMWEGADNLLHKALHRLADGDDVSALRLVERACRLPYDDHEDAAPAALAAHLLLFEVVTDEAECAEGGDIGWLAPAVTLLYNLDGQEQVELRACLRAIRHDYAVEPREARLIDTALNAVPEGRLLQDRGNLDPEELTPAVTGILRIVLAYETALGRSS